MLSLLTLVGLGIAVASASTNQAPINGQALVAGSVVGMGSAFLLTAPTARFIGRGPVKPPAEGVDGSQWTLRDEDVSRLEASYHPLWARVAMTAQPVTQDRVINLELGSYGFSIQQARIAIAWHEEWKRETAVNAAEERPGDRPEGS